MFCGFFPYHMCISLLFDFGVVNYIVRAFFSTYCVHCICHGRKSNLVEFQILPVESPI